MSGEIQTLPSCLVLCLPLFLFFIGVGSLLLRIDGDWTLHVGRGRYVELYLTARFSHSSKVEPMLPAA
jgi:hypothetical protein